MLQNRDQALGTGKQLVEGNDLDIVEGVSIQLKGFRPTYLFADLRIAPPLCQGEVRQIPLLDY